MSSLLTPWKFCVILALLLVIAEGAIRKWLFPGLNEFIYFAKDGFLGLAYIFFLFTHHHRTPNARWLGLFPLLSMAAVWIVAEALNSALGSLLVGAFGAKCYLWYIPLMFLVPYLFGDVKELEWSLRLYLLILVPVCLLGFEQFFSPADSVINRYAAEEADVSGFSGEARRTRITGTFAFITGHVSYLQVMAALLLALFAQSRTFFWFWVGVGQFVLIVGNLLMSGSRGPALIVAGMTVAFFASTLGQRARTMRNARIAILVVAVAGGLGGMFIFDEAFALFRHRVEESGDFEERLKILDIKSLDEAFGAAGAAGYGAGATQPGGEALRRAFAIPAMFPPVPPAEAEYIRVMLEIGPVGFFAWYGLRIYLVVALWKTWRSLRFPLLRQLCFAALMLHLASLPQALVLNHTFAVYYWFVSGFIFLLPRLEVKELEKGRGTSSMIAQTSLPARLSDQCAR